MSLVGSLEDLALGDILQIVSLSRKSGLLLLRSNSGEGRIVLSDGLVRAAYVKGGSEDLRGLLVGGGFVPSGDFDDCVRLADESGRPLEALLGERTGQSAERIDSLRREHLERAVLSMFRWRTGEFAFEVRDEIEACDRELMIRVGVNAQYLTMEATRLGDEGGAIENAAAGDSGDLDADGCDDDFMFSGEEESREESGSLLHDPAEDAPEAEVSALDGVMAADVDAYAVLLDGGSDAELQSSHFDAEAAEALALAAVHQMEDADEPAAPSETDALFEPDAMFEPDALSASDAIADPGETPVAGVAAAPVPRISLVVVDPELSALEWIKASLADHFVRIHIFQRVDGGIDRIRQYLSRSECPLVFLSSQLAERMRDGEAGFQALIERLKALSPGMQVLLLQRDGGPPTELHGADGQVACPSSYELADRRRWSRLEGAVTRLRAETTPWVSRREAPAAPSASAGSTAPAAGPEPGLARLREVSARLRDPASRGDVLSLVLEFAAETFNRVAMFMLRDDHAVGIAQIGLERAGGPDDHALQDVEIDAARRAWFREVIASRQPVRSAPTDASNRRLTELLGTSIPTEAYVAPIESGGRVAALLYGDNLPEGRPIADTTALEIVLHEAGLALDRALLERALGDPVEHLDREESA